MVIGPLNVAVPAAAVKLTTCGVPTTKDRLAGDTDTPPGIPVICAVTSDENPFSPTAETMMEFEPPIATERLIGLTLRAKLGVCGGFPPPVVPPLAPPPQAESRHSARTVVTSSRRFIFSGICAANLSHLMCLVKVLICTINGLRLISQPRPVTVSRQMDLPPKGEHNSNLILLANLRSP